MNRTMFVIGFEKKVPLILQFGTKNANTWNIEKAIKFSNLPIFYTNVNIHIIGNIICLIFSHFYILFFGNKSQNSDQATLRVVSSLTHPNPMGKVFQSSNTSNFLASCSNKS